MDDSASEESVRLSALVLQRMTHGHFGSDGVERSVEATAVVFELEQRLQHPLFEIRVASAREEQVPEPTTDRRIRCGRIGLCPDLWELHVHGILAGLTSLMSPPCPST